MLTELIIVFALVLGNGIFAGAEIALLTIRKTRLQELVDKGSRSAQAAQSLRDQPERFLATVQIGITVVSAASAVYGGDVLADRLAVWLAGIGAGWSSVEIAFAGVVAIISYLSLVVGELVPKRLALQKPEAVSLTTAPVLDRVATLTRPLIWLLSRSTNAVVRLLGVDPRKCWMRKWSLVASIASAASQQTDTKLPRGARLSAVYVDYNDVDNVDGDRIELGVNNFSRSIFRARRSAIEAFNRQQFPFDDNAIPTTMFALDLDAFGIVAGALDTRAGSGISDVILRTRCQAAGTSGNVRVIAEEYLPATKDAEASA